MITAALSRSYSKRKAKIPNLLSVDIGTTALKLALISLDGKLEAFAREPYLDLTSVSAVDWESAFQRALCTIRASVGPIKPASLCISGNGPTLVPLTFSNESLSPLHWYDKKAAPLPNAPSFFLPYAARFKEERPAEYDKVRFFLSPPEWFSARLGAEPAAFIPADAYRPFYWDTAQLTRYQLAAEKFPPFVPMGTIIGTVTEAAASLFGIAACTPIVAGSSDFIAALIGTGTIEEQFVCCRAGSSEGINVCCSQERVQNCSAPELRVLPHAIEGLWNIGAVLPASGLLFDGYRNLTGQGKTAYDTLMSELITEAAWTKPLTAAFFPSSSHGAALFSDGPLLPERLVLGRAVLEAIGFQVRGVLQRLSQRGFPVYELRCSGGQCKSPLWNQLKAELCATSLLIPQIEDGELCGSAILAALGLDEIASITEGALRMVHIKRRFEPQTHLQAQYAERFAHYEELKKKFGSGELRA
ncbi:xylulokinase [Breznakiellaceae bacterium SP9]